MLTLAEGVEVGVQTETHELWQNDEFPAERRVALTTFCRAHDEMVMQTPFKTYSHCDVFNSIYNSYSICLRQGFS